MIAQGEALGKEIAKLRSPERAGYERIFTSRPFRASFVLRIRTQGFALGYRILPFQGIDGIARAIALHLIVAPQ